MLVFKFGGASVKDAESFRNIPKILGNFNEEQIIVIISAMGKTTNALERIVNACYNNKAEIQNEFYEVKKYHYKIIEELFPDKANAVYHSVDMLFTKLNNYINSEISDNYNFAYDQIVSFGEMISSTILSHFLKNEEISNAWFDITRIITTDGEYRNATVNWLLTTQNTLKFQDAIRQNKISVMQGFIGCSEEGNITTLGREGSDYSAAIIAYCFNAESVTIWKDVQGVMNADPKFFSKTCIIEELSYGDAVEMAYYGATVIHPKTIKPLQNKKIPLYVRSFVHPEQKGTVIYSNNAKLPLPVYIFKRNQVLVSIFPNDFSFIGEVNLRDIFSICTENKVTINLMQNTAISFSIVTDFEEQKLEHLVSALQKHFKVKYNQGLDLITIRNYNTQAIDDVIQNKSILLEQKTRSTAQLVVREK